MIKVATGGEELTHESCHDLGFCRQKPCRLGLLPHNLVRLIPAYSATDKLGQVASLAITLY